MHANAEYSEWFGSAIHEVWVRLLIRRLTLEIFSLRMGIASAWRMEITEWHGLHSTCKTSDQVGVLFAPLHNSCSRAEQLSSPCGGVERFCAHHLVFGGLLLRLCRSLLTVAKS